MSSRVKMEMPDPNDHAGRYSRCRCQWWCPEASAFLGALRVPDLVDEYSQGLFPTKFGPLYVNAGIGYSHLNVRFLCRPEITVIEF